MGKRRRVMKPVRYNAGNMNWYRIELNKLIREMNKEVRSRMVGIMETHTIAINNDMANDAISPVEVIKNSFGLLAAKWIKRFSRRATELSREMVQRSVKSADIGLQSAMKQEGFAINLQWNEEMTQGVDAIVAENVSLIRSIPEKYFTEVEGMVYRSISRGGDRKSLVDEILANFSQREGITLRRAKLIANDQVRKATARLSTIRSQSVGITEGIWIHSAGQNDPRHKHVKANGTRFKLSEGLPVGDKGQYVMPSEEISCGCTYRPIPPW